MDVVIDDGDHSPQGQQATLRRMWRFVRPGGLYIIEDVMTGAPDGTLPCNHRPAQTPVRARQYLVGSWAARRSCPDS